MYNYKIETIFFMRRDAEGIILFLFLFSLFFLFPYKLFSFLNLFFLSPSLSLSLPPLSM